MKIYKKEKIIAFYSYRDYLSNHYKIKFKIDNIVFLSTEQAMMYYKAKLFNDLEIMEKLKIETFPPECKRLGRKIQNFKNEIWDNNKQEILNKCIYAKFSQNEHIKNMLLQTNNYTLVEASSNDKIWGVGLKETNKDIVDPLKWQGQNLLGLILMDVRKELLKNTFLYKEIKCDVFNLSEKYFIVQSVSKDGSMGINKKGVILPCFATEVLKRYPDTKTLFLNKNPSMPDVIQTNRVFNLVTKNNYWDKPNYSDVRKALVLLREKLKKENIEYIGMPKIESGMNKLEWQKIKDIIIDIFKETNIKIIICSLS